MKYEVIDETEVVAVKRGRKSSAPAELVEALRTLPAGKVVSIKEFQHDPKSEDYANHKSTTSAVIRSAGKQAGVKVAIVWHPNGYPQVTAGKTKKARKS